MLYDALIVGGGPAGLAAALALGRVCRTALVFDTGVYRNAGVTAMHTVLSRDGMDPTEFRAVARRQIERYPTVSFHAAHVTHAAHIDLEPGRKGFQLTDDAGAVFRGRKLVLATGTEDVLPDDIDGYRQNWPDHIVQCLFCDGFDERTYPMGVLAFDSPAYGHLSVMALHLNPKVTIYSNGPVSDAAPVQHALRVALASGATLDTRRIRRLVNNGKGPERGITLEFDDGPSVTLGLLMHKPPTRNRAQHLIDQLSLKTTPSGDVAVDALFTESSVPGCIVAGDTSEVVKQASLALGAGCRAGAVVSMQLCNEEGAAALEASKESQ
ncbi:Thioredoxin reductase tcpT [Lasiodiplodia hormozganensis]|uniref:Thioredoxin reductase tcpT n=1 Tax=Lasiodiplodia hormozganensis TaxID=869390 RepID=A0AA39XPU9_9PEZI|nr:Thioredoxin reductase tcpT [Lasiodiplodia hormozganensis]